ncbi:hypothetical protein U3A58_20775 [Algoriphagus sp. C2-6-M1]|uniref:hypothetical protein n=1 Tax=Algoriphagus persicinus TaxID=3108754 RepID=UPI002B3EBB47|nr:hypothetical protein [Algoriphagus sp. C2-6-M1]MEB2782828.1 hypothetical protein [Algoriphagus sp. C2-6-M1]
MEQIKSRLGQGGLLLAAMGILSMVLALFNYNFRLLSWVDIWGNGMGWVIRILLIGIGGALFFLYGRESEE